MCQRNCEACDDLFTPRANVPHQTFCSKHACQNKRRRRWQKTKLAEDADYRANQKEAQNKWLKRNPDYWRNYRQANPQYTIRNREQQRIRSEKRRHSFTRPSLQSSAKMDEYNQQNFVVLGTYRLVPVGQPEPVIAKMDECILKMHVLSAT